MRFSILFICCFLASLQAQDTVRITTQIWPPYQTFENDSVGGDATDMLRVILDSLGVPCEITVYPWKRAQLMVQDGTADAFYLASQNEARDAYAIASVPLFEQKWCWYYLKSARLQPDDSLFHDSAMVAANVGSNMANWLKKNGYYVTITNQTTDKLLDLLVAQKLDAVLANSRVMENIFANRDMSNVEIERTVLKDKPLRVYFSHRFLAENEGFLERFNAVAERLSQQQNTAE